MPVVNLPRDDRFGDLGKGLGGLVGGIANSIAQKQTEAEVSKILSDPSIPDQDKPVQILKQHGDTGYQLYKNLLSGQAIQAGIKEKLADVGLKTVQTAAEQAKTEKLFPEQVAESRARQARLGAETTRDTTMLAGAVAQQAAQTAATTASASNLQSQAETRRATLPGILAEQPLKQDLTRAQTEHTQVESGIGAAGLPSVIAKGEIAKLQLQQLKGTMDETGAATSLDKILTDSGIKPDSPLGNTAKAAYKMEPDINKKGDAFIKVISGQSQAEARAQIPAEAPGDVRKATVNSVEAAASMDRFISAFRGGGAEKIGSIGDILKGESPAALKVWLERHGFATGDESLVNMWNASMQNVSSAATSGSGFISAERIKLGKDTTPGVNETPLHAIIAADQVADRQIAALENQKLSLAPKQSKGGIDDALKKWRDIKATTGTLNTYVTNPGKPEERTVTLFDGNQIDSKSFKKLIEGQKEYKIGQAAPLGSEIIDEARLRNVAPDTYLQQLQSKFGKGR